jgi:hypothetical protein
MFHIYIASVLSGCCVCVVMFFKCFICFFANVSYECFKRFICLLMYVASVVSGCFKSRLGVVSLSLPFAPLHPSQTAKDCCGPLEGARHGMARMRAYALSFCYICGR